MLYISSLISIIEVLIITIPALLVVAFVTVAERKTMASMQRRLGPNIVGYYGLLQAFADALKLLLKEYVSPTQANIVLFFLAPIITLVFSLLGYAVIPYGPGLSLFDYELGILFMLAVSSIATYGILLAGWSANSKYAFLGSLRSTAQLISYELVLSSAIFLVILLASSLNLTAIIESQKQVWLVLPLLPIFIIFFIAAIAETNRAPFDLAEAESELVSGFMTEHSAVVFVFFFLAEYASIVLICILTTVLFTGGYLIDFKLFVYSIELIVKCISYVMFLFETTSNYIDNFIYDDILVNINIKTDFNMSEIENITKILLYNHNNSTELLVIAENILSNPKIENLIYGMILALKSFIMIFVFIWVRASFPRIRYDQLMSDCWTILLPVVFAFIILIPCIMHVLDIMPFNVIMI